MKHIYLGKIACNFVSHVLPTCLAGSTVRHPRSNRVYLRTCISGCRGLYLPWRTTHVVTFRQVPLTERLPSDEDLSKEVVNVLSGVDVFKFNVNMLMKHLSKLPLCMLL